LWYDNVGGFFSNENVARSFAKEFKNTCTHETARVTLKQCDFYSQKEMSINSEWRKSQDQPAEREVTTTNKATTDERKTSQKAVPTYIGLEIGWEAQRTSDQVWTSRFTWRISREKLAAWKKDLVAANRKTPRLISRLVGIGAWTQHVSLRPLCLISDIIEKLRAGLTEKTHSSSKGVSGWDSVTPRTQAIVDSLVPRITELLEQSSWCEARRPSCQRVVRAASDSSKGLWGYVFWDNDAIDGEHGRWNAGIRAQHIYLKELTAAVIAIERLSRRYPGARILLGVDNTAAAAALSRMYSTTHAGNELVWRAHRALEETNCSLDIITIPSGINPADPLTRGFPISAVRNAAFLRVVELSALGRHLCIENRTAGPRQGRSTVVRHREEPGEDDDFDSEDEGADECLELLTEVAAEGEPESVEWQP
jgi:hypothetical protein